MIPCQRHLFDIPRDVAYLNCAYVSPIPTASRAAGDAGMARKSTPWTIKPQDFFSESEAVRCLFAELIGATAEDIAIIPSVSYGVGIAAANVAFNGGQTVVVLEEQFPSNVYPWRQLATERGGTVITISAPGDGDWGTAVIDSIDDRTAVVALPHCLWTDGSLIDLERVSDACKQNSAALVIDATQSLGALPFDVTRVKPDFLISACYKWLLGPYSLGFIYVSPEHQNGQPLEQTWIGRENSEDFAGLINYRDTFQPGARRFDVGERSNFALMPVARSSLELIREWGVDRIAGTLGALTYDIAARAQSLGLTSQPEGLRASHFLGIRFPDGMPPDLVEKLSAAGVHVSVRGTAMRVTPHLYNDVEDVDRLFEVLKTSI
jgi:selenocysteine lyase/cysteine desulfurase